MPSSIVLGAIFGDALLAAAALGAVGYAAASFAINMLVSSIIAKALAPDGPNVNDLQNSPNPGNRQQMPPATDNKLPVVYGSAYVGGIVTDLSITDDNQTMYFCIALSEVTNTETGTQPDTISFGDIYWGGKKCIFDATDKTRVVELLDESTGESQTTVDGKLFIYLFNNGSYSPTNGSTNAVTLMSADGLTYKWDSSKKMSNCAFAIVKITYNSDAGLTGLSQTKFQVINQRNAPGDCFADYLTSTRYGAAMPQTQIDYASLSALNTYCQGSFSFTTSTGGTDSQTRFRFDGTVDTQQTLMNNLQQMASSCDCLLRYNEVEATWGVIVQSPAYSIAMAINDSNMVSAIQITPTDLASTPNIIETKFANSDEKDAFASAVFSLSQLAPSLLYPNEPTNKQTSSLPLVNNNVRAQYIATRLLKAGREDLIVKVQINYAGLQLDAGDIVSLTSTNYGWTDKLFRLSQVVQIVADDGQVTANLTLMEYNPSVYDDAPITQFAPAPNTGIPSPLAFGTVYAPTIGTQYKNSATPSFNVDVVAASAGVSQYAEVWYSAYANPTSSQRIFAGTTIVKASGNPYTPGESMGSVSVSIPQGDWYFFCRMVNNLGTSQFSAASAMLQWRPTTIQFDQRYVMVAYADDADGNGFSVYPTNKTWYGLFNQDSTTPSSDPADYTWYEADPVFGTGNFLLYINRGSRKFSFGTGDADYANTTGAFVPTDTSLYDPTIWSAMATGDNHIDLDLRTGQLLTLGTSSVTAADGLINVTNTPQGLVVASLERFLNFGDGVKYKTSAVANLTIDIYGRVVGFTSPDVFNYTETVFSASAGQTVFTLAHTVGNIIIFRDGILLGSSDYTETSTNFTLGTACIAGEKIVVINMAAETTDVYYEPLNIAIGSSTSNSITYTSLPYQYINAGDQLCFDNTGTPTTFTVSAVNYATKVITFTGSISGATAGLNVYRYRAAGAAYKPFSRYEVSLSNAATYTPTQWALRTGYEMIFLNGVSFTALDYNITDGTINGLPNLATGVMTIYQFNENNLSTPCANPGNSLATTITGVTEYAFPHNVDAFELYANGVILARGYDFTDTSSLYTLTETPANDYTVLHQQTFARVGAA